MTSPAVIWPAWGSHPRRRGLPADRRRGLQRCSEERRRPTPPRCRAPRGAPRCSAGSGAVVAGRLANSSCVRSTPVSMIVSGLPAAGRSGAVRRRRRRSTTPSLPPAVRRGHRQKRLVGRDDGARFDRIRPGRRGAPDRRNAPDREGVRQLHAARFRSAGPAPGRASTRPDRRDEARASERAKGRMPRPTPAPRKARGPRRRERPRGASRQRT